MKIARRHWIFKKLFPALAVVWFCSTGGGALAVCAAWGSTAAAGSPSDVSFLNQRTIQDQGPGREYMAENNVFGSSLFPPRPGRFRRLEPDPELLKLEQALREQKLLENPEVQKLVRIATFGTRAGRPRAIERLKAFLQAEFVEAMRLPDPNRPYGPASLLSGGDLHIMDQVDGVAWRVPTDALLTGCVIAGTQGGGKTRALLYLLRQLVTGPPPRRVFILDPKGELSPYADYLNATALDANREVFDLAPPDGDYARWFQQVLPQLGSIMGLIQGVELLQEAGQIAIEQLERYRHATGRQVELCLQDIGAALPLAPESSRGRRSGYLEAAQTGVARILMGSGNMFRCRRGLPLAELFSQNVILNLRHLTDELACRWLAQFLLQWKFQEAQNKPETNRLETLMVIDDASRFISAGSWPFDKSSGPTPLTHVLSVLRSSGTGLCVVTQLPAAVDPGVLALSNMILVVGGVHGLEHQRVLAEMMGLNLERRAALGKLVTREAVGFYGRGAYREPIHGFVPHVPDPSGS